MARRARLRADPTSVEASTARLGVAYARLHDVDGPTSLLLLSALLDIREKALNFLMSRRRWHVRQIG